MKTQILAQIEDLRTQFENGLISESDYMHEWEVQIDLLIAL